MTFENNPVDHTTDADDVEVLVVDEEIRLADLFGVWLETDSDVETVYDGEEALEAMSETVEVVLLDRRMPGLSGDEVLDLIKDDGYDCRVVMITAVDPDFDVVGMEFDDYLLKPVSKDDIVETVDRVRTRSAYEEDVREYYALSSKKALLESERSATQLSDSDEYADLVERVGDLDDRVDDILTEGTDHDEFVGTFRDLPDEGRSPADVDSTVTVVGNCRAQFDCP
jgi:DNA-binding NtrC family response regulator